MINFASRASAMYVSTHLKAPDDQEWLAVVSVTPEGKVELVTYLGDIPEGAKVELEALQQRWTTRATWPEDKVIQAGATIREYHKYPEEIPGHTTTVWCSECGATRQVESEELYDPRIGGYYCDRDGHRPEMMRIIP